MSQNRVIIAHDDYYFSSFLESFQWQNWNKYAIVVPILEGNEEKE